ncbi:MAG TPA: C25 family cysteine peptidase [Candidatus Sumerlaeia bacterium]|nr:C25 family cysteine peptidase [Candidatus Sumerlaeia bacterium]
MNGNFSKAVLVVFMTALMVSSIFAVPAPVVTIKKSLVSPASKSVNIGEFANYQIVVKNMSVSKFVSVKVNDFFSSRFLEYVSASPEPDVISQEQGMLSWTNLTERYGPLMPSQSITISVTFKGIAESMTAPSSNRATVEVRDDSQGNYEAQSEIVYVTIMKGCPFDGYEPNNSMRELSKIMVEEKINGYICPVGDKDYFSCALPSAGIYRVMLDNLPEDFDLYVYDSEGTLLGESSNSGRTSESFMTEISKPMSIIILVAGDKISSYLPYQLQVKKVRPPTLGSNIIKPRGNLVVHAEGLNPGTLRNPTIAKFYFNKISPENLLGSTHVLPDGRIAGTVKLPPEASGENSLITELSGGQSGTFANGFQVLVPKVDFDLWIDDAWRTEQGKKPIVNKVVAGDSGIWKLTIVDVVCNYVPLIPAGQVKVQVSVEDDLLGAPSKVYTRAGHGGAPIPTVFTSDGGGKYHATIESGSKQIVFRFRIPKNTAKSQYIDVTGAAFDSDGNLLSAVTTPRQIRIVNGAPVGIFINRNTLFRDMDDNEAALLLADIYSHSQFDGKRTLQDRRAIIYNVDSYILQSYVVNWDNTTVNYGSTESIRNEAAIMIRHFMRERFGAFISPSIKYVLIVGNDEQFPFYRHLDPYNGEKNWEGSFPGGDKGNPALRACFNNCYLTDDFYASLVNLVISAPWKEGDVDLTVGRIIGDSAADMRQLYLNGHYETGHTYRSVMASVDGWELGYEPSAGGAGEINDFINVPQKMISRGFSVFRDTEVPRTIDVLAPYAANWATKFQESANGGMDLFFIGGHNSYNGASIPKDSFDPSDVPSKYTRFDSDRPIAMITGCHGGLPVPNVGWGGGANNSMVYNVIHNGARAYFGASGYSYGSPGSLQHCTFAERYLQIIFWRMFAEMGTQTYPIGDAIKYAKTHWTFGIGNDANLDKKTVTEYNLFGIPWQRMKYPGFFINLFRRKDDKKPLLPKSLEQKTTLAISPRSVKQLSANTYEQSFEVNTESFTPANLEGFEIINIPDGVQQYIHKAPLLPASTKYSIILPPDGKIVKISAASLYSFIGVFNIPTVIIGPWSESGVMLTDETDIDEYYPKELAQYTKSADGHYLFNVFPIQHNPTDGQTIFHSQIYVTITYETEHPYGITGFEPMQNVFDAAQNPVFNAEIFNMGNAATELSGKMEIRDDATNNIVAGTDIGIVVQPGAVFPLTNSLSSPLPEGSYSAWLELAAESDYPATATASFSVRKVYLVDLAAEYNKSNNDILFKVRAVNRSQKDGMVRIAFVVSEDDTPLYSTSPSAFTLNGDSETTFTVTMPHQAAAYGVLLAEAVASFDDSPIESVNAPLIAYPYKILLSDLIDHILGREALLPDARKEADINKDGKLDAADVIRLLSFK